MKEADYEPEEGEIQDDDESLDVSQPVSEDKELGKNKRAHVSSYSHLSARGDSLHHRLLDPNMHPGERFRAAIMDWVAPSKSNSTRSTRYRDSIVLSRHPHSRHCVKEGNNLKSLGRSTQRDTHSRETHSTSSKSWFSTYSSKLSHERNNSKFADSNKNSLEPSTRCSYYCKTGRGLDSKRKPMCDKSTNTMERRQKYFDHPRKHNDIEVNSKDNNKNISNDQVPDTVETNDEPVKESVSIPSPAKSDCSDIVEIINVPRKEPEVITIEDSEEEVDKISGVSCLEAVTETNIIGIPIQKHVSLLQTQLHSVELPHCINLKPVSSDEISVKEQNRYLTSSQCSNDSSTNPLTSNIYVDTHAEDVTEKENDDSLTLNQLPVLEKPSLESTCTSDTQDKQSNDSCLITCTTAPLDQVLDEVNMSAIVETQVTSDIQANINITPILDNSAQVDNREIVPVNCTKQDSISDIGTKLNETSVTKVCLNKNLGIFSKENPLQFWGNSCTNRDSKQNKKITSFSLGQVLTNRVYSDSTYIRQPQYATVYFDRIGTSNGKCSSYDGQKYRFSVKVPEFIINIGRDSDSGDDSDNIFDTGTKTDSTSSKQIISKESFPNPTSPSIPVDFEKKLDVLLKQARYQQEEKALFVKDSILENNNTESSLSCEERINACETVSSTAAMRKQIMDSEGCARVLPSLKSITSSKMGKAKSKISALRNSYSTLISDKYNGNGLYVKAAKKLVARSIDLNKHLLTSNRNRKFLSRSKVINQTSSIPSGVNIGLLSPHKQREYMKLKRKIIQLTRRSNEEQSMGKAKTNSATKIVRKENNSDKAVMKACTMRNKVSCKDLPQDTTLSTVTGYKSNIPHSSNENKQSLIHANGMESDPGTSQRISHKFSKCTNNSTNVVPTVNKEVIPLQKSCSDLSKGESQRSTHTISSPKSDGGQKIESDSGTSSKSISSKPSKSIEDSTNGDPTVKRHATHIQKNNGLNDISKGEPQRSIDANSSPKFDEGETIESVPHTSRTSSNKTLRSTKDITNGDSSVNRYVTHTQKNNSINDLSKGEPGRSMDSIPCSSRSESGKNMESVCIISKRISDKLSKSTKDISNGEATENQQITQKGNSINNDPKGELWKSKDSIGSSRTDAGKNMRFPSKRNERNISCERRHRSTKRQCVENIQHAGEKRNSDLMMKSKHSEQLWSTETKLIAKRREVLENISSVRLNLHKIEAVNFKRKELIQEIQKLNEQLKQTELHLMQKEEYLSMLNSRVEEAKHNIQRCQSELLSLTLECEEIGCKVDGPNYNTPNTCADLIRNEMAAMSEAIQLMEIQESTMQS